MIMRLKEEKLPEHEKAWLILVVRSRHNSALLFKGCFCSDKDEKAGSDGLETEDGVEEEESSDDFLKELQNEASSIEGISERIKQIKVSFHSKQNSKEQKTAKKIIEYIREIKKLLSELNA